MKSELAESLRRLKVPLVLLYVVAFSSQMLTQQPVSNNAEALRNPKQVYGELPLSFEANHGQADPQVKFLARGAGYALSFTDSGALFAFYDSGSGDQATDSASRAPLTRPDRFRGTSSDRRTRKRKVSMLRMRLDGARTDASISGEVPLQGTVNYFAGNDAARWHTGIPTYGKVRYSGVYPGVDLIYYGNQQQLEYDFVVAAGTDPGQIRMHFDGARNIAVDARGDLTIGMDSGSIQFHKPTVYQRIGGTMRPVEGSFEISASRTVGCHLGEYDHTEPLIIDPVLAYSTYLETGWVTGMAVDDAGEVVISGIGFGPVQTTPGAFETKYPITSQGDPIYIAKLNAEGTGLIFATFLDGRVAEDYVTWAYGIGLDGEGNVYVAGETDEKDFPITKGAFRPKWVFGNHVTGFVSKLSADGTKLIYSTFLGGTKSVDAALGEPNNGLDALYGIAVDKAGHAYVTGITWSSDFPTTPGAYQRKIKPANIRNTCSVSKLKLDGSGLEYATYLGGSLNDECGTIAIDGEGNATVGGFTVSDDYPVTAGALPRKVKGSQGDGMISKLNPEGTRLLYSTYLGGSSANDDVWQIADDPAGNVYVLGGTDSTNFPTTLGAFQNHMSKGSLGAYVARFSAKEMTLSYATYLGEFFTLPAGIAADSLGNAYITGDTGWGPFPVTRGAFLTTPYEMYDAGDDKGGEASFMVELNPAGSALRYSTFLGGSQGGKCPCAKSVAIGPDGDVYLAGKTYSPDIPVTSDAFQTALVPGSSAGKGESVNAFAPRVMKLNAEYMKALPLTTITVASNANPATKGSSVTFTAQVSSARKGGSVPTGEVGFDLWGVSWESVALNAEGVARLTVPASQLPRGESHMVVMYLGDDTHAPSNANMTEVVE